MAVLLRDIIANGLCVVNVKRSESESESESKGAVYRQLVSRGGGLVGAFQPRSQFGQVGGISVVLGIPGFKVALPIRTGVIIVLPENSVAGVVENFPAFIALGK